MMRLNISAFIFYILCGMAIAQPKESMCEHASLLQAYDTLGDCYWYGVGVDKDEERAKAYYLYGAMQNSARGEYGKLRAANTLLFKSSSPIENAMGIYILKDFSDREDVEKTTAPQYAGDYTRRGAARYYLSIYLAQNGNFESAKSYLIKSLDDNHGYSAFAIIYLNDAGKISPPLSYAEVIEYMEEGKSKQREFFFWQLEQGYSCWLKHQIDGGLEGAEFPVDHEIALRLLEEHGPCSSIPEEQ